MAMAPFFYAEEAYWETAHPTVISLVNDAQVCWHHCKTYPPNQTEQFFARAGLRLKPFSSVVRQFRRPLIYETKQI